jgi:hypothetical protein
MKGDFTRDTFDPSKHYCRVLTQQGRVTLDADANEQTAILLHYLRALARDLIGPFAAPADDPGFKLAFDDGGKLTISAGRYYVDGILVINDQKCLYSAQSNSTMPVQPDYPASSDDDPLLLAIKSTDASSSIGIYLDVWERHITPIEDDKIREKALGGAYTCTRAKVVWQVKAVEVSNPDTTCEQLVDGLYHARGTCGLAARVNPGLQTADPCVTAPASKYRGVENHLYRVEVHEAGTVPDGPSSHTANPPTFKWSRDNGSVVSAWLGTSGNDIQVASTRGFTAGNWVELSDDALELRGQPGTLVKLAKVEGETLSIDPATVPPAPSYGLAFDKYLANPKVRRWDQVETDNLKLDAGAVPISETPPSVDHGKVIWIDLEDGIQIQFQHGGVYHTGDYWLIPARVAGGSVEWPDDDNNQPALRTPDGVVHHYAPLGFVQRNGTNLTIGSDCLCAFYSLSTCQGYYGLTKIAQPKAAIAPAPPPFAALPVPSPQPVTPTPPKAGPPRPGATRPKTSKPSTRKSPQ